MYIENIKLINYRNYKELDLSFSDKVNLIIGDNAQGKTNILEAIYMSSIGKSFRTKHDSDLIMFKSEYSSIKVKAVKDYLETEIEILLKSNANKINSVEKYIKKDRKNISKTSDLLNNIFFVIFSPEDLKIVKDEPEKRRKFIDRELSQISLNYYDKYMNYKKVLLQRNSLIKENNIDFNLLSVMDSQLATYGSEIILTRDKFIKKISDLSADIHSGITGNTENLIIKYVPNIEVKDTIEEQMELFNVKIEKSKERDLKNRTTTAGPHRDDIRFEVEGVDMRNFGSQGQQRTCALSVKLAELNLIKEETGEDAILLLDDVMSELDLNRQEYLIDTLKNNQLFITTTSLDSKIIEKFKDINIWKVKKGKVDIYT